MTFLELINLIEERQEKIIFERVNSIQTDTHLYERIDNSWEGKEKIGVQDKYINKPIILPIKSK
jgi:hypothetical protein